MSQHVTETTTVANASQALGDERRLRILFALLDGRALPATRLAMEAGVSPSTTSAHLKRLVETGFLNVVPPPPHHGRHRFYQIAGPEVASLCESLMSLHGGEPITSLQPGTRQAAMRSARMCYDHVAGNFGVSLMDAFLERQLLAPHDAGFALTPAGEDAFSDIGIDLAALRAGRRQLIRHCVDWSEQRPHLSGALGSALRERLERRGWIQRLPADRILTVTPAGREGLRRWIDVRIEESCG